MGPRFTTWIGITLITSRLLIYLWFVDFLITEEKDERSENDQQREWDYHQKRDFFFIHQF